MSGTPSYRIDDVRVLLVAQTETLAGFKHARIFWGGVQQQGAQIGDRTFDIKWGESTPLTSQRSSLRVQTAFTLRLRHRMNPKDSSETLKLASEDPVIVKTRLLERGRSLPDAIERIWVKTGAPISSPKGEWIDTDISLLCRYWEWQSGPPDAEERL